MQRYIPGDLVEMEIPVQHKMNLRLVYAVFVHEEKDGASLLLTGNPQLADEQWAGSAGVLRSEGTLELILPPEVTPGIYRLDRVSFETHTGKTFVRRDEEL